jgi:hypothetical protein
MSDPEREAGVMKAAYIDQFGGPEVLKFGDLPDPTANAGEVIVDALQAHSMTSSAGQAA